SAGLQTRRARKNTPKRAGSEIGAPQDWRTLGKAQELKLTHSPPAINLSVSVDTTVSCRVVEGLALRRHGNRLDASSMLVPNPARHSCAGENEKNDLPASSPMRRGFLFVTAVYDRRYLNIGRADLPLCRDSAVTDRRYSVDFMEKHEGFMRALKCRECGREYPLTASHVCEFDFGPLEVVYDYDQIKKALTREAVASRSKS